MIETIIWAVLIAYLANRVQDTYKWQVKRRQVTNQGSSESANLLVLRIRSLVADKEMVTATANHDLTRNGEWRLDYQAWSGQIDAELYELLSEADTVVRAAQPQSSNPMDQLPTD